MYEDLRYFNATYEYPFIFDDCLLSSQFEKCKDSSPSVISFLIGLFCFLYTNYYFAQNVRTYISNPIKANTRNIFFLGSAVASNAITFIVILCTRYSSTVENIYTINYYLRCFVYLSVSNQGIFLISLTKQNLSKYLFFISKVQKIIIALFLIFEIILLIIFDSSSLDTYRTAISLINISLEALNKCFFILTCGYGFVFIKKFEWILSPYLCKVMKINIFVCALCTMFWIIANTFSIINNTEYIPWVVYFTVKYNNNFKKYKDFSNMIYLFIDFFFEHIPLMIIIISMLFFLHPKNEKMSDNQTDNENENLDENKNQDKLGDDFF